jgi:DNA repair protein SbcD/Mre11
LSTKDAKVKILFVGDMHLGVLPSHVPPHLSETRQLKPHDLGPNAAWKRVIDAAIEHQVHAVALAGDLVHGNNEFFEAFGPLETGLRRLEKAGIPAVAVAGNHDTKVLPRLAQMIDTLHLLGAGGTWSSKMIHGDGGLKVQLTGWSFPHPHVETSPLSVPAPKAHAKHPTLGLLHADLDQSSSRYAPVTTAELLAAGYSAWFLGHIHKPDEPVADGRPFYLGSVTGLHPGETGEHGPVLVTMDSRERMTLQRLPLAPLRWETMDIPCQDLKTEEMDLLPLVLNHINTRAMELGEHLKQTRAMGFRLNLTGAMDDPAPLRKSLEEILNHPSQLVTDSRGTVLFIDKISNETTLRIDLFEVAKSESPEGLLARTILVLEDETRIIPGVDNPGSMKELLISKGRQALAEVDGQTPYLVLNDPSAPHDISRQMAQSGRRALEEILSRKEASHAAE